MEKRCVKCLEICSNLITITPSSGKVYLCSNCYGIWLQVYNNWKKTGDNDFWMKGWNEFLNLDLPFNPSYRKIILHIEK